MRLLPMGDAALLVETSDIDAVLAIDAALSARVATGEGVWAQVDDLVPAARTVLVVARPTTNLGDLASAIRAATKGVTAGDAAAVSEELEVRVRYDGPDLGAVASHTGLTVEEVIAAHTETPWRVGFGGFAPGFAYLVGGDPRLQVPRLDSPRTCVPAGSVALAGEFSAIYPRQSPGGWQLIGTTDATLWDADREPPALLVPGMTVRFKDESR
ncbi:allophanate hydrolase subunit 1 [Janibacter sp. GXQ6167]|uniref:5-oxoprolinase subunit B family protein n=1 Tax=Janibacter sp. GXQ6167 TaxID=3240791 RepID=UPI0035237439